MNTNAAEPHIVLIGGTMIPGSVTETALRYTAGIVAELGGRPEVFAGPEIDLPMFAPENPERTPMARRLVGSMRACDGIILASAGYHGALSGMIKNVLDYTEDMSRDPSPYFHGRVVGLIGTARTWRDVGTVLMSVRSVVHALRGWPTPLGVAINTTTPAFDTSGQCTAPELAKQLRLLVEQVLEFAHKRSLIDRELPHFRQPGYLA